MLARLEFRQIILGNSQGYIVVAQVDVVIVDILSHQHRYNGTARHNHFLRNVFT